MGPPLVARKFRSFNIKTNDGCQLAGESTPNIRQRINHDTSSLLMQYDIERPKPLCLYALAGCPKAPEFKRVQV